VPTHPPDPGTAPPGPAPGGATASPWRRRLRLLARGAAAAVASLALLWFAFAAWVESRCIYAPPELPAPATADEVLREADGVSRFGASWLHEDEGIRELFLEGDPVARGRAMASLCADSLEVQEDRLMAELDRLLPSPTVRYFLRKGLLFAFRDLPEAMPDEDEHAVAAMAAVVAARPARPADADLPAYHRMLFYQSLYDIGQSMAESGIVDAGIGCTSFAASGPRTADGGLVFGRNCDFEAGAVFDERKTVQFLVPESGMRFVSVAWAGMLGVVSGVNEEGLVVALHAARTERTRRPRVGVPVPLLLRDAMLHDRTIEEVAARLRNAPPHAAAIVVVAEGRTGRSAILETDAGKATVVPSSEGLAVASNHFRDPSWDGDAVVAAARTHGSSAPRLARATELLEAARGRIDVAASVSVLRDGRGPGGAEIGLGNRTAVGAFLAAHAMVYDAKAGRLLVSRAPNGLGEFVVYDLRRFFDGSRPRGPSDLRAGDGAAVPASPEAALADGVHRARGLLRASAAALRRGRAEEALRDARLAADALRRSPESLLAVAEALLASGDAAGAAREAAEGLRRSPVPGPERNRLTELAVAPPR
jgi:hypothetical protein